MPTITVLDIPPGLEDAFWSIFQFSNTSQNVLNVKSSTPTRHRNAISKMNSLFVKWQSLYDSFDSARRASWTVYWESLPFGSHGGANGWPGSGYSAFIYVNAPRYANGLALLLDPPVLNLIFNGDFALAFVGWNYFGAFIALQKANFSVSLDGQFFYTDSDHYFSLDSDVEYHFSADIIGAGGSLFMQIYSFDLEDFVEEYEITTSSGKQSFSFTLDSSFGNCVVQFYANPGWGGTIDNIVLS